MSVRTKAQLLSILPTKVITGGRQTTAQYVRDLMTDIFDSYANIVDGGQLYQSEVGYSTNLNLTQNTSFTHKKYVDDAITAISIGDYYNKAGNSFGANAILGLNDNFDLILKTNGVERSRILSAGEHQYSNDVLMQTNKTWYGTQSYIHKSTSSSGVLISAWGAGGSASWSFGHNAGELRAEGTFGGNSMVIFAESNTNYQRMQMTSGSDFWDYGMDAGHFIIRGNVGGIQTTEFQILNTTGKINAGKTSGAANGSLTIGYSAGDYVGLYNTIFGVSAGSAISTGAVQNTFLGYSAVNSMTTGSNNTGLGFGVASAMTTGSNNTYVGSTAGAFNFGASSDNVLIGFEAGYYYNSTGTNGASFPRSQAVIIGSGAGKTWTGAASVLIGYQVGLSALAQADNTLAIHNSDSATPLIHGSFSSAWLKVNGDLFMKDGETFDVENAGTTTLNIGTNNATVINIGTGNTAKVINVGSSSTLLDQINIYGSVNNQQVTNLVVSDKLVTYNDGGVAASGFNSGFEIEEGGVITGYFYTGTTRNSWVFKAPAIASVLELSLASLTANRILTVPDATTTIAGKTGAMVANYLTYWSDANQVTGSANATLSAAGAMTLASTLTLTNGALSTASGSGFQFLNGGSAQFGQILGLYLAATYGVTPAAGQIIQSRSSEGSFIELRSGANGRLIISSAAAGAHAQIFSQNSVDLRLGVGSAMVYIDSTGRTSIATSTAATKAKYLHITAGATTNVSVGSSNYASAITGSANNTTEIAMELKNTNTGTAAGAIHYVTSDAGTGIFGAFSVAHTSVPSATNRIGFYNLSAGGMLVGCRNNTDLEIITNDVIRTRVTGAGSLVHGGGALATNATDGFLYIPTCAGTPTGVPTAYAGRVPIIYDSTNDILYIYSGGAWKGGTNPGAYS